MYRFLCVFALLAPLLSLAVEPLRVVATGGRIANTFYEPAAANTSFRQRTPHKLGGPVAEMRIGFMDWMYPYDKETPNGRNDVTIDHAWLERASTGQIVPLTFSGSRTLVLPMNSTTSHWLSDPVPSALWTGAAPARDEVFWLHLRGSIPTGGMFPTGTPTTYGGSKLVVYPPANEPGKLDTAGPVPAITGATGRNSGLPLIFLGRFTGPGHLSVIGVGDSILDGTGDVSNPAPVVAGYGFFNRAAVDAAGANTIAMFNSTRHGQAAANFANSGRQYRQTALLQYANVVVEEYGTNDLGTNGTGTPSTILANVEKIWTAARAAGVQKIVRTKLLPRTSVPDKYAPDAWATLEMQTPNPGWEAGGKRDTINAGFQIALAAGKIDVLLDTLAVLAAPTDPNRWRVNGTAKYVNVDDAHVSPAGNALLAPHLRAALLSLTVDEDREDYARWSASVPWNGADSSPGGDANGDGVSNLLAYALGLSPVAPASDSAGAAPAAVLDTAAPDGPWLSFEYRKNPYAVDLAYVVESSADLAAWTPLAPDGVTVIDELADPDPDGDGAAVLRRVRVRAPDAGAPLFLRLRVTR